MRPRNGKLESVAQSLPNLLKSLGLEHEFTQGWRDSKRFFGNYHHFFIMRFGARCCRPGLFVKKTAKTAQVPPLLVPIHEVQATLATET
jgi:hypothetical protein